MWYDMTADGKFIAAISGCGYEMPMWCDEITTTGIADFKTRLLGRLWSKCLQIYRR